MWGFSPLLPTLLLYSKHKSFSWIFLVLKLGNTIKSVIDGYDYVVATIQQIFSVVSFYLTSTHIFTWTGIF